MDSQYGFYIHLLDLQNSLPSCNNMFVGFGSNHAVDLLTSLSNHSNGDYNFVNSAENAGMLYEIYFTVFFIM